MISTKLTMIAALAVASVSANIKLTFRGNKDAQPSFQNPCVDGWSFVLVEGKKGNGFCTFGDDYCGGERNGPCPDAQVGLPHGSYCGTFYTGAHPHYICKEYPRDTLPCGKGETPVSVEGVKGVFCVKGKACGGDVRGACPVKGDHGLQADAVCARIKTGKLGCKLP